MFPTRKTESDVTKFVLATIPTKGTMMTVNTAVGHILKVIKRIDPKSSHHKKKKKFCNYMK